MKVTSISIVYIEPGFITFMYIEEDIEAGSSNKGGRIPLTSKLRGLNTTHDRECKGTDNLKA